LTRIEAGSDLAWLAHAAVLAGRARPSSRPNPPVGAVIVNGGRVLGRGWTRPGGRPHAEAVALDAAGEQARGGTMYVTLEPCAHVSSRGPACADLASRSRLARVVVGVEDPDGRTAGMGLARIREAGVVADLLPSSVATASLGGYLMRRRLGRPHVTLKLATSLDGCLAQADGTSRWITGEVARAHAHLERARADAILVGGGTLRADAPRLDVRLPGLEPRGPERWLLSRGELPAGWHRLSSPSAIGDMADVSWLLVEGGAQTAAAFLAADLVDRLLLYRAPINIGAGRHAVGSLGAGPLADKHGRWRLIDRRQLGSDVLEEYERARTPARVGVASQ
jgi:diaminohydroxyphosphoribosylaminopyrimidine deaminase / 5-amino-6-(5-phosphoribosylamino)uracil reductase